MAEMQEKVLITDETLTKLNQFSYKIFRNNRTFFSMQHITFAKKVADLASKMYYSRDDLEYRSKVSIFERENMSKEINALALTSYMCENSFVDFDLAFAYTNASVSKNLKLVVMDKTNMYVNQLGNKLAALSRFNSYWNCEPLFVFLAKAVMIAKTLGADIKSHQQYTDIGDLLQYKNALWGTYHILNQFKQAHVDEWSATVGNELEESCSIVKNWNKSKLFPKVNLCCGCNSRHIDWFLNMNMEEPIKYDGYVDEEEKDY